MSMISIPTPFAHDGLLYVTSGYVGDPFRKPVYAIKPGAKGDITLKKSEDSNAGVAWVQRQAGPYHPTPVVVGKYLYVLHDRGFLACYDAKSGKEVHGKRRLTRASAGFTASPWTYNGKLFCLSEDGTTYVVKPGEELKVEGKNALGEMCLATPAIAGGNLFI